MVRHLKQFHLCHSFRRFFGLLLCILALSCFAYAENERWADSYTRVFCETGLTVNVSKYDGRKAILVHRNPGRPAITIYQNTDRSFRKADKFQSLMDVYGPEILSRKNLVGKRILDAGCGRGTFVRHLKTIGAKPLGIDLHLTAAQLANPELFKVADMADTKLPAESFDIIITSFSTFYYEPMNLNLLHQILVEFSRLLARNGIIYLGGNPAHAVNELEANYETQKQFLFEGWTGKNRYLDYFLPPNAKLAIQNGNLNPEILILFKGN